MSSAETNCQIRHDLLPFIPATDYFPYTRPGWMYRNVWASLDGMGYPLQKQEWMRILDNVRDRFGEDYLHDGYSESSLSSDRNNNNRVVRTMIYGLLLLRNALSMKCIGAPWYDKARQCMVQFDAYHGWSAMEQTFVRCMPTMHQVRELMGTMATHVLTTNE